MIIYKSPDEILGMKKSNRIVGRILSELQSLCRAGTSTLELNQHAEKRSHEMGAVPACKGYRGYPASLCTSINEEIVHGIPSARKLKNGDIISLDFGVIMDGYYGDAAVTYPVGDVTDEAQKLIEAARASFFAGVEKIRPGKRISDISHAVQECVESYGFSVIRMFVGHGIGFSLHEEPQIPNFGSPGHGPKIKPGMTLAVEPMIAAGHWDAEILADHWTAVTMDRRLSSHFEHTVAVTEEGVDILSYWEEKTFQWTGDSL